MLWQHVFINTFLLLFRNKIIITLKWIVALAECLYSKVEMMPTVYITNVLFVSSQSSKINASTYVHICTIQSVTRNHGMCCEHMAGFKSRWILYQGSDQQSTMYRVTYNIFGWYTKMQDFLQVNWTRKKSECHLIGMDFRRSSTFNSSNNLRIIIGGLFQILLHEIDNTSEKVIGF